MNDPVTQGAQAALSFMDIMRQQPLSLALVVMNICLLGFLYYNGVNQHAERQRELELLYTNRREVGELLAHCYPAPPVEKR